MAKSTKNITNKYIDVTKLVKFGINDDESLPITQCICGQKFPLWYFYIGIYDDDPCICPNCGAKLFFRPKIKVYKIEE